jgi:DNA-binding helix-turn-helix protein|nr:MAG TPA: helix-turn-helix domain protein [Caudoviricetes sp.]
MKEAKVDDKERLKELRKETGLSQTKFAERFKIPLRTIQDWEYGKREIRSYIIDMMCRIIELEKELENK